MKTRVQCYAGYRGGEEPQSFDVGATRVNVAEVTDRWRTPQHNFFKVKVKGGMYVLRQEHVSQEWEMTALSARR